MATHQDDPAVYHVYNGRQRPLGKYVCSNTLVMRFIMKKTGIWILSLMVLLSASSAFAYVSEGQFTLSPQVGGYVFDKKQHLKTYPVYGIRLGYNFSDRIGVEGGFDYALTKSTSAWYGKKVDFFKLNADLLYHFMPESNIVPYLAVGGGAYAFFGPAYIVSKETKSFLDYGAGVKLYLNDKYALRADARHVITASGNGNNSNNNFEYTLGVLVSFGGAKPAANPVEPVAQVVAQPAAAPAVTEEIPAAAVAAPQPEPVPVQRPEPPPVEVQQQPAAPASAALSPVDNRPAAAVTAKADSSAPPVIHDIIVGSDYIEIQGDRPLNSFRLYGRSKPLRQVIDFPAATTDMSRKTVPVNRFGITQARVESDPSQVRIIFDTNQKKFPLYSVESKGNSMKMLFLPRKTKAPAKKMKPAAKK